jgi:hypothetical protein
MSIIFVDFKNKRILDKPNELILNKLEVNGIKDKDWYEEIKERTECRFGDDLPKHFKTLMSKEQKYPYMYGCSHNIKTKQKRDKRFNTPYPVPCKVKSEVDRLLLTLNHGDPLMWMDLKNKTTYNHIKSRKGKYLYIQTRSDLIAHDDYIEILDKENHIIEIVTSNLDDQDTRIMKPGAPSNERRIKAYKKLKELGYNVVLKQERKVA